MWPTIGEVNANGLGIHPYGIMIVLAFCSAFLYIHVRASRVGIHPDKLVAGYVAAAVGGMLGARVLYALSVEPARTFSDPLSLLSFAGFAVYGGILGGILGVWAFVAFAKLDPWKIADLAAPAVVIAMGVGRIGCFFSGCCHGAVAPEAEHATALLGGLFPGGQLWLSGTFPFLTTEFHSNAGNVSRLQDVPLYPTQVWDAVGLLTMGAVLAWAWTKRRFDGQIAALTLIVQPPLRIFVESFRADSRGYVISWPVSPETAASLPPGFSQAGGALGEAVVGVTTSQGLGLALMLFGVVLLAVRRNAAPASDAPVRAGDGDLLEELT